MRIRQAAGLAIVGALAVLVGLYLVPWHATPCDQCDFLGTREFYSENADDYDGLSLAVAFFRFGHVIFGTAAVLTALALLAGRPRLALAGAGLTLLGGIWFAIMWGQIGVINTLATAFLAPLGGVLVVLGGLGAQVRAEPSAA